MPDPLIAAPLNSECTGLMVPRIVCSCSTAAMLLLMCIGFRSSLIVLDSRNALSERRTALFLRSTQADAASAAPRAAHRRARLWRAAAFAAELLLCAVHPAPGLQGDLSFESLGRQLVYRFETVAPPARLFARRAVAAAKPRPRFSRKAAAAIQPQSRGPNLLQAARAPRGARRGAATRPLAAQVACLVMLARAYHLYRLAALHLEHVYFGGMQAPPRRQRARMRAHRTVARGGGDKP